MRTALPLPVLCILLLLAAPSQAGNVERGKSLYDTKCHACHDRSVHNRASRKARSYAAIRREVVRWEKSLGGGWSKDEVEDVTLYLNETHYKLPCPEAVCKQQRPSGNIAGTARAAESPAAQ